MTCSLISVANTYAQLSHIIILITPKLRNQFRITQANKLTTTSAHVGWTQMLIQKATSQ